MTQHIVTQMKMMVNTIAEDIQVTVETVHDFPQQTLPTLEFQLWVGGDTIEDQHTDGFEVSIHYRYFEKPGSAKVMIIKDSAMP